VGSSVEDAPYSWWQMVGDPGLAIETGFHQASGAGVATGTSAERAGEARTEQVCEVFGASTGRPLEAAAHRPMDGLGGRAWQYKIRKNFRAVDASGGTLTGWFICNTTPAVAGLRSVHRSERKRR
jgi:hypothetical protein